MFCTYLLTCALSVTAVLGRSAVSGAPEVKYEDAVKKAGVHSMSVVKTLEQPDGDDRESNLKYVKALQDSTMWSDIKRRSLTVRSEPPPPAGELFDKSPDHMSDAEVARLKRACHDGLKCVAVDQLLMLHDERQRARSNEDGGLGEEPTVRSAIVKITRVLTNYTEENHEERMYQYRELTDRDDPSRVTETVTTIVEDNRELCRLDGDNGDGRADRATGDRDGNTLVNKGTLNLTSVNNYLINNGTVNSATVNNPTPDSGNGVIVIDDGSVTDARPEDDGVRTATAPEHHHRSGRLSDDYATPSESLDTAPAAAASGRVEGGATAGREGAIRLDGVIFLGDVQPADEGNAGAASDGHEQWSPDAQPVNGGEEVYLKNGADDNYGSSDISTDITSAGSFNADSVHKGYVEDGVLNNGRMKVINVNEGVINKGLINRSNAKHGTINVGTVNNGPVNYGTIARHANNGTLMFKNNDDLNSFATSVDRMYSNILAGLSEK